MRTRQVCRALLSATIAVMTLHPSLLATKEQGYQSTSLARGRLDEMDDSTFLPLPRMEQGNKPPGPAARKKERLSDIYVQSNILSPGGSTGWHSHPGHSVIIVTAGTVTNYEGHDPACRPHAYQAGMAFVDPGGDHLHMLRNEGAVEAKTIAVQFIPSDAARRIDVRDPGNCHF